MSLLLPLTINIKITETIKVEGNVIDDLVVGGGNIDDHIDEVSARIAHWGVLYAEANKQLALHKLDNDKWMAERKKEARDSAKKEFKSEKANLEQVMMDNVESYAKHCKDIIDDEYNTEVIKSVLDAFRAKKDMLVSLSANQRSEMERDMLIKDWNKKMKEGR